MRFAILSSFLILTFFTSCEMNPKTPIVTSQKFNEKEYAAELKKERDRIKEKTNPTSSANALPKSDSLELKKENLAHKQTTDTIQLKIVAGKVKIDTAKALHQKLVFVLNTDTANKLNLKITPKDTIANLRISQIIDAKGNSDGPFGQEIQYKILAKGIHQIIVSESQMQGEPWSGKFTFEAKLAW